LNVDTRYSKHVHDLIIFLLVLSHPRLKVVDAYGSSSCGARLPFLKLILLY
jgi:hypothetical protein